MVHNHQNTQLTENIMTRSWVQHEALRPFSEAIKLRQICHSEKLLKVKQNNNAQRRKKQDSNTTKAINNWSIKFSKVTTEIQRCVNKQNEDQCRKWTTKMVVLPQARRMDNAGRLWHHNAFIVKALWPPPH